MQIIVKFFLLNIKEKKFRTFLIIFSLIISSALYFAAGAITKTVEGIYLGQIKRISGTSDIVVHANSGSPSPYFNMAGAVQYKERMEYAVGMAIAEGMYEYKSNEFSKVELIGIEYDDLTVMNPIVMEPGADLGSFTGYKAIIGKTSSEKYGIKVGDNIDVTLKGQKLRLKVCGISKPVGPFSSGGQTITAVVPRSIISTVSCEEKNQVSALYIKLNKNENLQRMLEDLSRNYRQYTVEETLTKNEMEEQLRAMRTALSITTLIVLFISAFIIYTSFKVITTERLPVIGTFRSIGATKLTTGLVMLAESLVYGIIGGSIGTGLGIVVLHFMTIMMAKSFGTSATLNSSPIQLATTFLMAILVSIASSALPIIKTSKIPVKEIVLNKVEVRESKKNIRRLTLGIIFLVMAVTIPRT
ncbi:MAG: hypothetical protein K0R54_1702 [Clostridiaceae bacterium]|jgi:putative ABC transport system permease protein|nr:hypothetical protein [Clostridiaceae bacterium]